MSADRSAIRRRLAPRLARWLTIALAALCLSACVLDDPHVRAEQAFDEGDYVSARRLWRELSEAGDADAPCRIGRMYLLGLGARQNDQTAARWFELAAARGNPRAQAELGVLYAQGRGVNRDLPRAYAWLSLAAMNYPKWENDLRGIAQRNRETVSARMNALDLIAAQQLIESFRTTPAP
jgi:TPR repeat protein